MIRLPHGHWVSFSYCGVIFGVGLPTVTDRETSSSTRSGPNVIPNSLRLILNRLVSVAPASVTRSVAGKLIGFSHLTDRQVAGQFVATLGRIVGFDLLERESCLRIFSYIKEIGAVQMTRKTVDFGDKRSGVDIQRGR